MSSEETNDNNEAILKSAIDNWNEGDLDGYLQIYDPGVVLHGYVGVEPGLENVKKFYQAFLTAFPGVQITIDDILLNATRSVAGSRLRGYLKVSLWEYLINTSFRFLHI